MTKANRRYALLIGSASLSLPLLAILQSGCTTDASSVTSDTQLTNNETTPTETKTETTMKIHYLEIVSTDDDAICKTYEQLYGVKFRDAEPNLGNARVAGLPDGSLIGIRAPLRDNEAPVMRPYFLVDDIESAVATASEMGAKIALPPMKLAGQWYVRYFYSRWRRAWIVQV